MKTKDLIKLLQETDPSGEMDCVVNNVDIFIAYGVVSYWDGCKQLLIRDETNKDCYNVVAAEYRSDGWKVQIETMDISEALLNDPDLPVKVVDTFVHKQMQERVDKWRQEIKEIKERVHKYKKENNGKNNN